MHDIALYKIPILINSSGCVQLCNPLSSVDSATNGRDRSIIEYVQVENSCLIQRIIYVNGGRAARLARWYRLTTERPYDKQALPWRVGLFWLMFVRMGRAMRCSLVAVVQIHCAEREI